jgi:hypothetical protein
MKILNRQSLITAIVLIAIAASARTTFSQDNPAPPPQIETLVVGAIKVSDSLTQATAAEGRGNQLRRVAEAMDTQFRAALSGTRKFKIVVGGDLGEIMAQQKRGGSGLYNSDDANAVKVGQLRPPKYVVVPTIDDFQDVVETMQNEGQEQLASARRIRISVVATIYDINTGEEKETANIQVSDRKAALQREGVTASGDAKDELLLDLTKRAAQKAAQRVVDVVFPAKIVSRTDKTVTINRGDGTGVAIGQIWNVFALGQELKDPDTGASLGHEEIPAGQVRITSITPLFCKGEVIDDKGVEKGQIIRMQDSSPAPDASH